MGDRFDTFDTGFFSGNRARLRQRYGGAAPIVVTANGMMQRNGDCPYRFRQDSNFWYLTGIAEPDIVLVMDKDKDKDYLIVPSRDIVREAFDGVVTPELLSRRSGVEMVLDEKEGWRHLGSRLKRVKRIATLHAAPAYIERQAFYTNPARATLCRRLRDYNDTIELVDLREHLMRLRSVKQPSELEAIQQAVDVTINGLAYVTDRSRLAEYGYENEIEADLTRGFRRAGCGHAFDPIIASGERACQMHYLANSGPLVSGELLVLDVGAEAGHYAADVARTVVLGEGGPTRRQQQVYDAVRAVQEYALTLLKPGTVNVDYEKLVEHYMGEKLRELGVIKTASHEAIRKYFPHATTHFLGLDAHDTGDYRQPMEPDMVMVCEPGIYIPEEKIGVRIEDVVLITASGCRVLSGELPHRLL